MIDKIKLYIFHPYSDIGGADLSLSRLINNLDGQKYSITFITFKKAIIKKYLKKKIDFKILNVKRALFSILEIRRILTTYDKGYKKKIFISNQNFANIISIFSLIGLNYIKLILVERNNPIELDFSKKIKDKIIKLLMKIFYKKANKVISISKELGSDLKKLTNSNIQTIYNAAFDKEIYKKSKEKNNFKKNCKIILNVARFEKQKNHLMLLKAFKTTVKKINCKLILVGYGSEERNIKKFIKFNNLSKKVFIYKNSKNSYKFYKIADLFVLTSLYEGFGNVLVEAGMFKVPIISTNCKSGPKEILKNGRCGDLIKVNDYKSLSKCMIKNLKKKNTSKINAMYNSLNRFKIKTHISKYEKIFNEI